MTRKGERVDKRYVSTATWDGEQWVLRSQEPAVSSTVRSLAGGVAVQRRALADAVGVPESELVLRVSPVLPEAALDHMVRARELRDTAAWANRAAAGEARAAAKALASWGLSLRDIGWILGVSFQRAHQLITS